MDEVNIKEKANMIRDDEENETDLNEVKKDNWNNNKVRLIFPERGEKCQKEDKVGIKEKGHLYPLLAAYCDNWLHVICLEKNKKKTEITGGKRCYHACLSTFVMLDLILLTGIIVVAYFLHSEMNHDLSPDIALCLQCKDLKIHPDDVIEGLLHKGEKTDTCCMNDIENYDALIGYFVDHWLKENLAKDDRRFTRYQCQGQNVSVVSKPYIKLVGRNIKQTEKHDKVLWDARSDAALLSDNKDFAYNEEDGLIEIKKTGHYQIYSQVVFNHETDWYKMQNKANLYQHHVIRIAAGRSENDDQADVIMKASNSYCSCKTYNQTVTSYMNGAFQLSEGDRLAVTVRINTEIVPAPHNNFFGVHMLL